MNGLITAETPRSKIQNYAYGVTFGNGIEAHGLDYGTPEQYSSLDFMRTAVGDAQNELLVVTSVLALEYPGAIRHGFIHLMKPLHDDEIVLPRDDSSGKLASNFLVESLFFNSNSHFTLSHLVSVTQIALHDAEHFRLSKPVELRRAYIAKYMRYLHLFEPPLINHPDWRPASADEVGMFEAHLDTFIEKAET